MVAPESLPLALKTLHRLILSARARAYDGDAQGAVVDPVPSCPTRNANRFQVGDLLVEETLAGADLANAGEHPPAATAFAQAIAVPDSRAKSKAKSKVSGPDLERGITIPEPQAADSEAAPVRPE